MTVPIAVRDASLDLSLPLSTLLKQGTAAAHETAENTQGAIWLTRGELDKEEYVRFLVMLWHIYDALEQSLEKHSAHPVLSPTYNPALLARTAPLYSDIAHILQVPSASLPTHPLFAELATSPPPALTEYTTRLNALATASDPALLLAHAYVRYLGDLSGGQVIRRRVARAYGLSADGAGTEFYAFGKLGESSTTDGANLGDLRRIKVWFRSGMDAGVGDDRALKAAIVEEAKRAFELNTELLSTLRAPTNALRSSSPLPSPPPSPALSTSTPPADAESETKAERVELLQTRPRVEGERMVSVASVTSFIIALGLAHFILVVGGFTGSRGWEKLEALQAWLAGAPPVAAN